MKKLLPLILLLICTLQVVAQTSKEKEKLKKANNNSELLKIAKTHTAKFSKQDLLKIATKNNWEYRIEENGSYSELIGISKHNKPIYYQTYNEGAGVTSRANTMYTGGSLGLNIHGENMTSGIWDAGQALPTHELFSGRITVMDGATSSHFHATHVAGTVIGTDQVQNGLAKGMAFRANGLSYDWFNDVSEVATAANNGLLLSNHSYGLNPAFISLSQWGKYDDDALAFDDIMFNAPYFQFVCAAGNSRGRGFNTSKNGYDLLIGHAMAKNGITVAAVREVLNYTGPSSVLMSSFSSWGATDDGRIKPDISAKGVNTFSAFDDSNTSYNSISGTSMASPSVNGTLLLLQQYHNELYNNYMRAATLRGLMIHTADEAGTDPGPDYRFGWGLINAEAAATVIKDKDTFSIMEENTLQQNQNLSVNYTALGTEPVIVTICWTDPVGQLPSETIDDSTPVLVNDLDVRVFKDGTEIFPWKLDVTNPAAAATTGDNIVDNVEKIQIDNPIGNYQFVVSHKGNLLNNQQEYSLIITGVSKNDFWFESQNLDDWEICNTNDTLTTGFDFFRSITASDDVALSLVGAPAGLTATFTPATITSENAFNLQLSGISSLAAGSYDLTIRGQSIDFTYDYPVTLHVYESLNETVILTAPTNNQDSLIIPFLFTWQAVANASSYQIQIATDAAFSTIIEDTTASQNEYTAQNIIEGSEYFWRVKPINACGEGNFSSVFSFTTACINSSDLILQSANSSSLNLEIINSNAGVWEIEYIPQGGTPTGTGTMVNTMTPNFMNLSSNTCYDFYIRSQCDVGLSNWRGPYEFCTTPDYCSGDHFYDSGGANGNYQNGENWTETIYPENAGDRIRAVFNSFLLENCCDFLSIYNGPDATYPLLFSGNGNNSPGTVLSTDPSGALTFVFTSDSSVTGPGWDAEIICESQPACLNIPSDLQLVSATSSTLTVGWTETGASTSWEVEIVPQGNTPTGVGIVTTDNPHTFTGLNANTAYDVYIRSICTGGTSDWTTISSISTTCAASTAPILETFTDFSTPSCWTESGSESWRFNTNAAYAAASAGDHTPGGGTNYAWIDGSSPNGPNQISTLTTNSIDISSLTTPALEFSVFSYNSSGNFYNTLIVELNDGTQWVELLNLQGPTVNNTWQTFIYDLSTYNLPNEIQVRYTIIENSPTSPFNNDILLDDISIDELPACPNTVTGLQLQSATSSTLTVGWTDTGAATSWEVEVVPTGTPATGIGTVTTDNPHTFTGLGSDITYDVYIKAICPDGNSDAVMATFSTLPNYCSGDHFYDSGGANGNYQNGENWTETIYPENAGDRIRAVFQSFQLESCCDFLSIYNGPDATYPLLFNGNGSNSPGTIESTDPSGALTFVFTSDGSVTGAGWDAEIICELLPACANAPTDLQLQSVTSSTLTVSWVEVGTSTSWEVEIVPTGTSPTGAGTIITNNPYTFTGLNPSTSYDVYIRSICADGTSGWTNINELITSCVAQIAPFTEVFSTNATPNCWMESGSENWRFDTNAAYAAASAGDHTAGGGTNYAWIDGSSPNGPNQISTLTTNSIDISNLTTPALEFSVFSYNSSGDFYNTLIVELNDGTQWVELLNLQGATANNTWQTFIYDLSTYNLPNVIQVRYIIIENSPASPFNNDILLDDISIDELPACPNSITSIQLQSATSTTLTVGWTETGTPTSWEVEIVPAGMPATGSGIVTTDNPYTFTGLNPDTAYDVYVRSICVDGTSDWIHANSLSTTCAPIVAPFTESFTTNTTPNCWVESGSESWRIDTNAAYAAAAAGDHTPGGGTNYAWIDGSSPNGPNQVSTLTTNSIDISNLTTPALEFSVFSYNSSGDFYNTLTVELNDGTQWIELLNLQGATANNTWQTFIYDLSTYNLPNEIQIRYTIAENSPLSPFNNDILIDDVSIDEFSGCPNTISSIQMESATSTTLTVGWTDTGSATSWEVEIVPAGTPATGSGTVTTDNPYVFTGLSPNTAYDIYIRSICANGTSDFSSVTFTTQKDYCSGDRFYDSGGISQNYQNGESWTETIYPENAGDRIKAIFHSFDLDNCCDYLSIYNGPDATYPLLFNGNGTNSPGTVESTDPSGALTFVFTSNSSITGTGWDAEIICETLGIEEEIVKQNVLYYPNPVHTELYVSAKKMITNAQVYDFLGRLIATYKINNLTGTIKFNDYEDAVYIMKLNFEDGTHIDNIKIIKN